MVLHLDFETYSEADLPTVGSYKMAEHPSTVAYMCAYRFDNGPVHTCVPSDGCPPDVQKHIESGGLVCAHNTEFELNITNNCLAPKYGWPKLSPDQCLDTMAMAACVNLPLSLANVGKALQLDQQKDSVGGSMMKLFMKPMPDGGNPHETDFDAWPTEKYDAFFGKGSQVRKVLDLRRGLSPDGSEASLSTYTACMGIIEDYCIRDVESECEVFSRLPEMTDMQLRAYRNTLKVNERGLPINEELAKLGSEAFAYLKEQAVYQLESLESDISFDDLFSNDKTKAWLSRHGYNAENLEPNTLKTLGFTDKVEAIMAIRKEVCSSSLKKFDTMLDTVASDGRIHGTLFFHSAITGRWGGRGVQPQNLPRPKHDWVEVAYRLKRGESVSAAELKSLVRPCIQSVDGFTCADWSNIEGRMLAWLAGEAWKLDAFREFDAGTGPDLYKLAYSRSFGVPIEDVDDDKRAIGKVQELALGYGGGPGAIENFAAGKFDSKTKESMKKAWRESNPEIVNFWYRLERAAIHAVKNPDKRSIVGKVAFYMKKGNLRCVLPSGREITYIKAVVKEKETPWGEMRPALFYMTVKQGRWLEVDTFNGRIAENVTQAACACLMMEAIDRRDDLVMLVHDEIVADRELDLDSFITDFTKVPDWAEGLPLSGSGWVGKEYRK